MGLPQCCRQVLPFVLTIGLLGAIGCSGDDGDPGPAGADGGVGAPGDQGNRGDKGDKGDPGEDGDKGDPGEDGDKGDKGDPGEDGDKGDPGEQGPPGPTAANVFNAAAEPSASLNVDITKVTIDSPPVIEFTVTDEHGRGAVGLKAGSGGNVRFTLAQLQEGEEGEPNVWQSYVNRERGDPAVVQATYDREGELVDNGDGSYVYTFATDITNVTDPVEVDYDASLTHRLVMQISRGQPIVNEVYDFVPDGGDIETTRAISATASCNECHNQLRVHGSRIEMDYCVTCHNPGTFDAETGETVDMPVLTHKIHMGANLPSVQEGGTYKAGGHDYSDVHFPQDVRNCRKCHSGDDEATPDGDHWRELPTIAACGSCHDNIKFDESVGDVCDWDDVGTEPCDHTGGVHNDNSGCRTCHEASSLAPVAREHATENVTPNNPELPQGYSDVTYEVLDVTVDGSNNFVIEFNTYADGTRMQLLNDFVNDGDADKIPASGSTRSPSFLFYFAMPQGNVTAPADYNNLGNEAGQPSSVSLANLIAGGDITDASSHYVATVDPADHAVPASATLRAVALQGYWQQDVDGEPVARHAISSAKSVTGDAVRREIVSIDKCSACHEIFEGHGGNRVFAQESANVCVACHTPNLSSSGRTLDLDHPEATNNMRDLIHGIHAAEVRTTPYEFVRNFRDNARVYDWSDVHYPGILSDCGGCHLEGTYGLPLVDGLLPTTNVTGDGTDATTDAVKTARENMPNDTDLVLSPVSSTCYMCHDGEATVAHMEQNGGAINWTRAQYVADEPFETCEVCHETGSLSGLEIAHGLTD